MGLCFKAEGNAPSLSGVRMNAVQTGYARAAFERLVKGLAEGALEQRPAPTRFAPEIPHRPQPQLLILGFFYWTGPPAASVIAFGRPRTLLTKVVTLPSQSVRLATKPLTS
jgi:hypothetical protein